MQDFLTYLTLPYLWEGAVIAIELLVGALAGGIIIGFFLALASLSRHWWIRLPVQTYIYILRGTPVLLQLVLLYNVLPQFGITFSAFTSALLALTINETAFCAEIIRGGIQSTDRDQRMAAQAFGFSRTTEMVRIVIPQALRAILPTLGNEAVGLLKSTSLASVVGVNELTMRGQTIVSQNFLFIPVLVASGAIYVILSSSIAAMQWYLERRVGLEHRAKRARKQQARNAVAAVALPTGPYAARRFSENAATILDIDDLHVAYRDKTVLDGITLRVRRGEVVVLLGRSGSGKSTLLKAILALAPAKSGSVTVEGHPIGRTTDGKPLRERHLPGNRAASGVGIVFQHFALFDHMTALENAMSIPRLVQRLPEAVARAKASRALASVGLSSFETSLPHELSGGQQQRVGIARALASEPNVLLFDEPTSALDPELVREVNQTIRDLAETGMTMLISTHDIAFAATVADRIVFLQNGRLVEEGPPSRLQAPETESFAAFLRQEFAGKQAVPA
ncbi:amino acid ABC transporter permease/ATP-binding protein [Aureimonas pseudogalii]|uniref:Polar amino acid transport system permease protein n=1 Tax=Aureimonas pseudogalii TaxID=1744844 RepID=A0A7W6H5Q5_9HYPH|nr:amino acid ABC transporter permease/ATP-binding protein [Aureimonas pseudogalii]MBB3999062.1 polar amino acid transport system permease protein [Aureimonas pseudogalii]